MSAKQGEAYNKPSRTPVNTGSAFQCWRKLKEHKGLRLDAKVALFLLDRQVILVLRCLTELICWLLLEYARLTFACLLICNRIGVPFIYACVVRSYQNRGKILLE